MQYKQTLKHKLGNRTGGRSPPKWQKAVKAVRQQRQQRQQRQRQGRLKNDFKNSLSYSPRPLTNMQNVAISGCCFVTFCKRQQRNEQRIIKRAYTATVLLAVKVC